MKVILAVMMQLKQLQRRPRKNSDSTGFRSAYIWSIIGVSLAKIRGLGKNKRCLYGKNKRGMYGKNKRGLYGKNKRVCTAVFVP